MNVRRAHLVSTAFLLVLALAALLPILLAVLRIAVTGRLPPPEHDEGTGAHIFQLSIAALFPTFCIHAATADWERPWRVVRELAAPAAAVAAAFLLLYHYEHP